MEDFESAHLWLQPVVIVWDIISHPCDGKTLHSQTRPFKFSRTNSERVVPCTNITIQELSVELDSIISETSFLSS